MKTVKVVAAVICDSFEEKTRIFATARGYGEFKGQWEFPGGKVEPGETSQQALIREIKEELDATIEVGEQIGTIEYDYPSFHLSMDCFWCQVVAITFFPIFASVRAVNLPIPLPAPVIKIVSVSM